jgi:GrpB-like predicted nucleotidyltransferase (UPF0157 family)
MIELVPYDNDWPHRFEVEAACLAVALQGVALRIEHVGSTAVPGLAAKPVIDIQVSVDTLSGIEQYKAALARLGYAFISLGDFDRVYPFFTKPERWPSTHHVHLCVAGEEQEAKHLAFRDFLRMHPEQAAAYAELKRDLAGRHHGGTLTSREEYSLAKTSFVEFALAAAGFAWRDKR